jgi:exosortase
MLSGTREKTKMTDKLKAFIVFALLAVVFYPVYPDLWNAWMNHSNNSHGILVPFVSMYFIWDRRSALKTTDISSSRWGLVVLVISLLFYLLALVGGITVVSRVMIVFTLIGAVLYLYGVRIFKILAFPLFFLLFMVPVPVSIVGMVSLPLQTFATKISAGIIQSCSIPVLREGNMLYFVQTQLEVAEACSGIRSIIAITMLSWIFVYLSKGSLTQKVILLCSAIPIALLANILRVSGTGILAHFYGDKVARGFLHDFSGLAVFVFGMLILLVEYALLKKIFANRSSDI